MLPLVSTDLDWVQEKRDERLPPALAFELRMFRQTFLEIVARPVLTAPTRKAAEHQLEEALQRFNALRLPLPTMVDFGQRTTPEELQRAVEQGHSALAEAAASLDEPAASTLRRVVAVQRRVADRGQRHHAQFGVVSPSTPAQVGAWARTREVGAALEIFLALAVIGSLDVLPIQAKRPVMRWIWEAVGTLLDQHEAAFAAMLEQTSPSKPRRNGMELAGSVKTKRKLTLDAMERAIAEGATRGWRSR